jgi:hypothetical protein
MDPQDTGGVIFKLIQHPPDYDPQVGVKYL